MYSDQHSVTVYSFDIPVLTLSQALNRIAQQTGHQLLVSSDLVDPMQSQALQGEYTVLSALAVLLEGTGLSGGLTEHGVIVVRTPKAQGTITEGEEMMGVKSKKKLLAAVVSFFAGANAGALYAQADTEGNVWALEEVVVTAQKREQNLQDVPISISVLGGEDLDFGRFESINDALNGVAGVNLAGSFLPGKKLSVRGVTSADAFFSGSTTVGYYLDEMPFGLIRSGIVPDVGAYDMQRVEVLRGPQGTLYGANALNGVIRIVTEDANLEEPEFKVRTSVSSTDKGGENYRGDLAMSMPIIPGKLAFRTVLGYNDQSGWIDKPTGEDQNHGELKNLRLKLNAQPTDQLSVELMTWIQRDRFGAPNLSDDNNSATPVFADEPIEIDYETTGLTIEYDFDSFSLLSATSFLDYNQVSDLDFGLGILLVDTDLGGEVWSQEVRLTSTDDSDWRWSLGSSYRDAEESLDQLGDSIVDNSESYAVFGEVTRVMMDGELELTLGARYFEDDVSFESLITGEKVSSTFDVMTPRVVLTWHSSDEATVYGSVSQGFRSGFQQTSFVRGLEPSVEPVEEDLLTNYEVGSKGTMVDGRLIYDLALYYIDWEDTQQVYDTGLLDTPLAVPLNGEDAAGFGLDFSLTALATENLTLGFALGWNDLTFQDDTIIRGGLALYEDGGRMTGSPEYNVGIDGTYTFPNGNNGYESSLTAAANYHSETINRRVGVGEINELVGNEMFTLRFSYTLAAPENWQASLYVDNATNEDGIVIRSGVETWQPHIRPRTIGMQFEYHY